MEQRLRGSKAGIAQTRILDLICVVHEAPVPLASQLSQQLESLISSALLKEGERLPQVREPAKRLGIHMHTVRAAYLQLQSVLESAHARVFARRCSGCLRRTRAHCHASADAFRAQVGSAGY